MPTEFTTAQLAAVLSALAGKPRKPATKAAALQAIHQQAAALGRTADAVLACAHGLLEGGFKPAAWREQLISGVEPELKKLDPIPPEGSGPRGAGASIVGLRPGTKQALIADLMAREQGTTLVELIAATGWLPHTTRAALTGLRRKGLTLEKSTREDGKTAYRVVPPQPLAAHDPAPTGVG